MRDVRTRTKVALVAGAVTIGLGVLSVLPAANAGAGHDACDGYVPNVPAPSSFVGTIDNRYFPLPVGRTLVYRGVSDGERQTDREHVTSKTKTIQGVGATVVHDVVFANGRKEEITNDWYAQDDQGNVWYLGEATRVRLGNGHVDRSGSWMWGVDGAKPGLIMEAHPQPPDAYRQECLSGQAEDMAWIVDRGGRLRVPYGRVRHVIRSFEFARIEPNVVSEKRYAPGIGIVLERDLHGGDEVFALARVRG
jgi:hypothetical protein